MHLTDGRRVNFSLLSLPFYLVGQVRRLVREYWAQPYSPLSNTVNP